MADKKYLNKLSFFLFFLTFSLLFNLTSSTTMADDEKDNISIRDLNAAIFALRSNGYNLFANAIAVSDLSFQILTVTSTSHSSGAHGGGHGGGGCHGYTLLAPPNSALFSLDMSTDAFTYVHSLRFHVIPRRLSYADLRNISLSSDPYIETLAVGHFISVASSVGHIIAVDGVLVSFPDMHLRPKIAVHGLDGILVSSASRVEDLGFVAAPQPFAGAFSPEIGEVPTPTPTPSLAFSQETGVPSPVPSFAPFSIENHFDSVSIPPDGFYSSDIAETPTLSPLSPSPTCSAWYDCELEYLAPYNWSPIPSPHSPSSMTIDEELTEGEDTENGDYEDHVNFAKYNRDQVLPPLENW
ncbi:uncharacterized protein LOC141602323 [Silene latifolia]|uniref:uncharacterized protein LOC141602323 n=1 Tax=Silene latifolia TaxID=37657 RepID=UPI003D7808F7